MKGGEAQYRRQPQDQQKNQEKQFNIFTPAATSLALIKKRQLKHKGQPCGSRPKVLQLRILSQTASNDGVRRYKPRHQRSDLCPSSSFQSPQVAAPWAGRRLHTLLQRRTILNPPWICLLLSWNHFCFRSLQNPAATRSITKQRASWKSPSPCSQPAAWEEGAEASTAALLDPAWAKKLTSSRPPRQGFCFLGKEQQCWGVMMPAETEEVVGGCRQPLPQL